MLLSIPTGIKCIKAMGQNFRYRYNKGRRNVRKPLKREKNSLFQIVRV